MAGCLMAAIVIGCLSATAYLVLRDDLIGSAAARQARMQHAYEDRISMLRTQVDRITSRQLLDQQVVESRVAELLRKQSELTERHGRLDPILRRASGEDAIVLPQQAPVPMVRPDQRAQLGSAASGISTLAAFLPGSKRAVSPFDVLEQGAVPPTATERLFTSIGNSLHEMEHAQIRHMETLTEGAFETASRIIETIEATGLSLALEGEESGTGGPYVPIDGEDEFDARINELDMALARLEEVKSAARDVPVYNPMPGRQISSNFGTRRDPFLRRPAMHSGMDFRARSGTPILAGGAGKVTSAGWNGGYGRMVEIDHGNGFTTRYAHMSRIEVTRGQEVATGDLIGLVGSTGRSTGPHLHYEVRSNGTAVDPAGFIRAGRHLDELL